MKTRALLVSAVFLLGAQAGGAQQAEPKPQPVITKVSSVMLLVKDQEEALRWYTEKLGFEKRTDQSYGQGQRWLTVAPPGQPSPEIVLEKATPAQAKLIGKENPWVFETPDCRKAYEAMKAKGVVFDSAPQALPWGVQATFRDLYGNHFTLISEH